MAKGKGMRECPICGAECRAGKLSRHMKRAHREDIAVKARAKAPGEKVSKKKSARREAAKQARKAEARKTRLGVAATIVIVVVISLLLLHFWNVIVPPTKEKYAHIRVHSQDNAINGDIVFLLHTKECPITTDNFIKLADEGFFDGLTFHRVMWDFMIQGGDPNGDGTGGPGYSIQDELAADHGLTHVRGVVSMANSNDPNNNRWNTGGSQIFIMQGGARPDLDSKHAIFGKVTSGMDVVDKVARLDEVSNKQTDSNNKPFVPVFMQKVWIETVLKSSAPVDLVIAARTMDVAEA